MRLTHRRRPVQVAETVAGHVDGHPPSRPPRLILMAPSAGSPASSVASRRRNVIERRHWFYSTTAVCPALYPAAEDARGAGWPCDGLSGPASRCRRPRTGRLGRGGRLGGSARSRRRRASVSVPPTTRLGVTASPNSQAPQATVRIGEILLKFATWLASSRSHGQVLAGEVDRRDEQGEHGQGDPGRRSDPGSAADRRRGDQGEGQVEQGADQERGGQHRHRPCRMTSGLLTVRYPPQDRTAPISSRSASIVGRVSAAEGRLCKALPMPMMQTPATLASTPQSRPRSGRSSRRIQARSRTKRAGRIEQADVRGRAQPGGVEEESLVDRHAQRGGDSNSGESRRKSRQACAGRR